MVRRTRRAFVATLGAALAGGVAPSAFGHASPAQAVQAAPAADLAAAFGEQPLARAHAHNDYEHPHPLTDALSHGFGSVEADIWLVDGELLVAHDASQLDPARTLEALYLGPLARRIRRGGGTVYPGSRLSLQLLIDIKTAGEPTYRELARRLRRYHPILTTAYGGVDGLVRHGPVTAVISGDRGARAPMEAERTVRRAFYDGRLADLGSGVPASFIPLVSDNWGLNFTWRGVGPMPPAERAKLRQIVGSAHAAGQRVRFWATPDQPGPEREAVWRELVAADADYLNTDDLQGLEDFLRGTR
ncbi:phosphatidylinositol-specific phospholipase C/glycerophosphodiester phosphodiesterase family protein [Streptomyces sp. B1866]|uniref:phosphatidylinositol-specific phospholipase C/glycerophosphodiester phosphodiesterase family protein n=1 Tax=Streptomyces sp. B1866 TaxID=3075431 RepID=UPI0028920FED|nr:phosphatidylinositol-specific phospholipase C/glycerophosphodiester phosphodiesterase family protein [Streptomyces sp. B1866]MDT3400485.1 phosphatidylinositol-specific phospholipase C/glycerophosphodiester phosphodiesterase family protein [Streptomyces sp. B1866]